MMRKSTEEEKKLWAIVKPYLDNKSYGLIKDAPPEAIKALDRLTEIDRRIQMQECGIDP